jgi:6-oxo-cyclohex-1-ene-carbonyl-CoA hydrolase
VFGKQKTGDALKAARELMKRGSIDLSLLDEKVEALCTKLLYTFPDCTTKTVEELRKPKLDAWNRNKENSRAWLALNMMTEARAGFRAFNEGTRETGREVDFIALRRALAANAHWNDELTASILPGAADARTRVSGLPSTDQAASSAR